VVSAIREPDGATLGSGSGGSKKAAEIAAAQEALERIAAGEV
jgi:dsRNA-specific ribonuclease